MSTPAPQRYRANKLDLAFGVFIPGLVFGPMLLFGLIGMAVTIRAR